MEGGPFSHVLTLRQDCERIKQDGVKLKKIYWSSNNLKSKLRKKFFFRTYNLELESNNFQNAIIYLLPGFSLVNNDNKGMQMIFDL